MVKLKSSLRKFYGRHHDLVNRYGIYYCHKWPRICSVCRNRNPGFSSFMTYHRVCYKSTTTGSGVGTETAYPSGATEFTPDFSWVRVVQSLVFCVVLCRLLSFFFCFWLPPLVSSNISYEKNVTPSPVENVEITCNDSVLAAFDQICYIGKVLENNLSDKTVHIDFVQSCKVI